jgi:AraC-like DNA-binding protein
MITQMIYVGHAPASPLNNYIYDLYYIDGAAPYRRIKALPMPVQHLMFNVGDHFQIYRSEQAQPAALYTTSWFVGLWNQPYTVEWPQNVRFYGIHFKPGGAYPFLQLPLSELHNQIVSLDAIWGRYASEIREQLDAAPTIQAGFALLEGMLLAQLDTGEHGLGVVQYAITQMIRRKGVMSVRALSDQIGISQNHLGTLFKRIVGAPPKELARYYRFAQVLRIIDPAHPTDWTLIARKLQYYDLSHLNKDFVAFTGHNPSDYLDLRRRFHSQDPAQSKNIGQLPFD